MIKFILCILCSFHLFNAYADEDELKAPKAVEDYSENDFEALKLERLSRIRSELVVIQNEINVLKKKMSDNIDMLSRIQYEGKIEKLEKTYELKRNSFIETVTNINLLDEFEGKNKTSFSEDIKQILDPALNTFKRISEKPRKMQELKDKISILQIRYEKSQLAKKRLNDFLETTTQKNLKWKLKESIKLMETLGEAHKVKLEDLQFKILKIENAEESIVSTFSSIIFEFIKTKGKNLLLSLIVFITIFWIFKLGQNRFIDLVLYKLSRSENQELYSWVIRPTKVIYNVVTTLMAFFLSILTLYVLNDWVLVTFILILFAAIIWSSKHYLPLFLEQSKIVLNLGSVREGERVMYKGLPWKIQSLGYYCKLENPDLSGASLRVNTKELINSHSRRASKHEPWFPCRKGDWVEVKDYYGKIILQSPQQVILKTIGGVEVFFDSKEFYNLTPKNLSKGFAIEFVFGLDYSLQLHFFDKVVPTFEKEITENLINIFPELKGNILEQSIDFYDANESSLDIRFFLKCNGDLASVKPRIERKIKAEFVRICNENHYTIPFKQITVHSANER